MAKQSKCRFGFVQTSFIVNKYPHVGISLPYRIPLGKNVSEPLPVVTTAVLMVLSLYMMSQIKQALIIVSNG